MRISAHIDGFIVARSYAPESERQRRILLSRFIHETRDPYPADLTPALTYRWWGSLAPLSRSSRRAHLSAVRTYLDHLVMLGELETNPAATISTPRDNGRPPVTLTTGEVARLLVTIDSVRDRAAVALMVGSALRAGDLARLQLADIDLDRQLVTVTGKGGRIRVVPMPDMVAQLVAAYIAERGAHPGQLLCRRDGQPLNHVYVRQRVDLMLDRAGLRRGARDGRSSHVLRRTAATAMLEGGASITDVAAVLGHSSIQTTQRYLAVPDARRLARAVDLGPLGDAA